MRKNAGNQKGSIVCTASNAGLYPLPIAPMYAASKFGVVGTVRSLARPLLQEGIQINALAPAVIGECPTSTPAESQHERECSSDMGDSYEYCIRWHIIQVDDFNTSFYCSSSDTGVYVQSPSHW
jgi:NAD(P)-dependent dehydrogenase (short-subunit alcohol dehydrogenase family)